MIYAATLSHGVPIPFFHLAFFAMRCIVVLGMFSAISSLDNVAFRSVATAVRNSSRRSRSCFAKCGSSMGYTDRKSPVSSMYGRPSTSIDFNGSKSRALTLCMRKRRLSVSFTSR